MSSRPSPSRSTNARRLWSLIGMGVGGLATKFPFWMPLDAEMSTKKSSPGAASSLAVHGVDGPVAPSCAPPSAPPSPALPTDDEEQPGAMARAKRPRTEARVVGRFMPAGGCSTSLYTVTARTRLSLPFQRPGGAADHGRPRRSAFSFALRSRGPIPRRANPLTACGARRPRPRTTRGRWLPDRSAAPRRA